MAWERLNGDWAVNPVTRQFICSKGIGRNVTTIERVQMMNEGCWDGYGPEPGYSFEEQIDAINRGEM